jgi:hypothetical protein
MSALKDNKNISLSHEVLLEIEEALNFPQFFGIPVGATLNDILVVALSDGNHVWNWRSRLRDYLRYRYQLFHQPFTKLKDFSFYKRRIIFTWLFDRSDLKAFVFPLVKNYDHGDLVVVGPTATMQGQLPDQTEFILWDDFPKIDMKVWRREFGRCVPSWRHRLKQVLGKHSIPQYVEEFLMSHLQVQTQRVLSAGQFLDVVEPRVIVTEYDRNTHTSCLLLVASKRGIPSVTMVHASAMPYPSYGFAPLLSNYACCWGEVHRKKFIAYGVNQDQLVITGCQATSRLLGAEKNSACLKVGLPGDKPVVLLATSPIKLEDRKKYTSIFCAAMSNLPEVSAVVRLHPAENIAEYQQVIDKFPSVAFFSNTAMTRDESLAAAEIVVSHESSFGIDALLKGKLVVVLDLDDLSIPLKIGKELIEIAGCPSVRNADQLESVVRKIFKDDLWRRELHAKGNRYAEEHCYSYGQDAVKNVCQVIDKAIEYRKFNEHKFQL